MERMIKALVFDVDGTISVPNMPISKEMAKIIKRLLSLRSIKTCILTAKSFAQIQVQVLNELSGITSLRLARLHLGVLQGNELYYYEDDTKNWRGYDDNYIISYDDEQVINGILEAAAKRCGYWLPRTLSQTARYLQNRGGQITFSGLGTEANPEEKRAWDPDGKKRQAIIDAAKMIAKEKGIPWNFEFRIGGTTSIDVTVAGQNKASGLKRMLEKLHLRPEEIVYFGDEMDEGGNDYPVLETGLYKIKKVTTPEETLAQIEAFLRTQA